MAAAAPLPVRRHEYVCSLKLLCLESVVDNFSRFMLAYGSGPSSTVPRKHFEFLQRTLSKELLQRLVETGRIEDEHFSFLINPYLKELNLNGCELDPEPILKKLEEVGENIKLLSLNLKQWSSKILLKFVNAVPSVETLWLRSTYCDDDVLTAIGEKCRSLIKLDVSYCMQVSNAGIDGFLGKNEDGSVKENNKLTFLDVTSTSVSDSAIVLVLKHVPMLQHLNYDHVAEVIYEMHATDFINGHANILQKYQLTSLCFFSLSSTNQRYSSQMLANVVQVASAFCPHITSIKIDGELDDSVLASCSQFNNLKEAMLSNVSEDIAPPDHLRPFIEARGPKLHKLDLKNFIVPMQTFSDYCNKLHTLSLYSTEFSDSETLAGKDCFPHMRELTVDDIDFEQESMTNSIIHLVSNSPKLEILCLRNGNSFNLNVVRLLTQSKCISTIKCIDVSSSDITAEGILELMTVARRLDRFHMELVDVTDEEHKELLSRSVLQQFTLSWRSGSMYSNEDDDDPYYGYELDDYYNEYMGYSDEYDNYDTDYSDDDFYGYPI